MKLNLRFMKLIIKLIILLIIFVTLFLISAFLYSARYWPDFYNYVNANITIKRISTLAELNLTVLPIEVTTETYSTTTYSNDYTDTTDDGISTDTDEFSSFFEEEFDDFIKTKVKRGISIEDINMDDDSQPGRDVVDYFFGYNDTKTTTEMEDVDVKRLTTMLNVEIIAVTTDRMEEELMVSSKSDRGGNENEEPLLIVYRWIGTIFIRNETSGVFDYICDGALITDNSMITAARCVTSSAVNVRPDDIIVVLGKRSLQSTSEYEKAVEVKEIRTHDNFTNIEGNTSNDLAIIIFEENFQNNALIQTAYYNNNQSTLLGITATTGWNVTGELTSIYFDELNSENCNKVESENTYCVTHGNDVPVCPSYGGLHVAKLTNGEWYLRGIRTGDTTKRGLCTDNRIVYNSLDKYVEWIHDNVDF